MTTDSEDRLALELRQREAVVAEARSWRGTPFHHAADVKGVGVDCGMLLVRVFVDTGIFPDIPDPRPYAQFHHLHMKDEAYWKLLQPWTRPIAAGEQQPGDIVIWKYGKTFSHAAIISAWPLVVHAYWPYRCVDESDISISGLDDEIKYPRRFLSPWGGK